MEKPKAPPGQLLYKDLPNGYYAVHNDTGEAVMHAYEDVFPDPDIAREMVRRWNAVEELRTRDDTKAADWAEKEARRRRDDEKWGLP